MIRNLTATALLICVAFALPNSNEAPPQTDEL